MTNEQLDELIDTMNNGGFADLIFSKQISDTVTYARCWSGIPDEKIACITGHEMYFVIADGKYVATVQDGGSDLHLFVKEEHRRHGYLCRAMNTVILHHLFEKDSREVQRLTFESPTVKEYCMRRMGFRSTGNLTAEITKTEIVEPSAINETATRLTRDSFKTLRQRLRRAQYALEMCRDQVCMLGASTEDLEYLIEELIHLDDRVVSDIEKQQGIRLPF